MKKGQRASESCWSALEQTRWILPAPACCFRLTWPLTGKDKYQQKDKVSVLVCVSCYTHKLLVAFIDKDWLFFSLSQIKKALLRLMLLSLAGRWFFSLELFHLTNFISRDCSLANWRSIFNWPTWRLTRETDTNTIQRAWAGWSRESWYMHINNQQKKNTVQPCGKKNTGWRLFLPLIHTHAHTRVLIYSCCEAGWRFQKQVINSS